MKKIIIPLFFVIILLFFIIIKGINNNKIQETIFSNPRSGVAVILTGAAARIPQEAALLEELDKRGQLKDLVFISGVSSGALNSVMLNGILTGKISWDDYKNILYNLKNSDVFTQEGKKIPVNTLPARALYKKVVEDRLGYYTIGDLPYYTEISFTHLKELDLKKTTYRMCSRKINEETDTTLNLVDIIMASSAFPLVFPPVKIQHVKTIPDVEYIDGGVGDDHVPFQALLEFEKFRRSGIEKVYIISRKSDSIPEISEELRGIGINDKGIFDKLGISLDAFLSKGILKRLEAYAAEAPELVPRTYIWIPDFEANFLLFDFDNLKKQYELTTEWAKTHDPVPLEIFLQTHQVK
ncbi:MAG: patatin-like phospholipase family protein [Bacteroidales bacterium]|nr:patatin-like phospholipase family protein [Bacteroidales bacterium]